MMTVSLPRNKSLFSKTAAVHMSAFKACISSEISLIFLVCVYDSDKIIWCLKV